MKKIFNLLIFLINTLLFARIKQKSKTEVRKQPFKRVKKVGKILERKTLKELVFGKVVGCRSTNFQNMNSFPDIVKGFCEKL